jgi:glycerophosphoryl diester phosphodiesterase
VVWVPLLFILDHTAGAPALVVKDRQPPPVISLNTLTHGNSKAAFVAHAMGEIDGRAYTDSLDAFNLNYKRGFRLFECDLVYLEDGTVFIAHDGHEADYGLQKSFSQTTRADIEHARDDGKYTTLTSEGLIQLVKDHPDVRIVLDTKYNDIAILRKIVQQAKGNPAILDHFMPNVFDQQYYDEVMQLYPFKYTILALYRTLAIRPYTDDEIVKLAKKNTHIVAVAINRRENDPTNATINNGDTPGTFSFKRLHDKLQAAGVPLYVHSIKDPVEAQRFRHMGVGVYLDIPL